jgi:hypothetical protein
MAHDVFISYSSKDKSISEAICAQLERQGIRCWMAPRDILPGQNYAESIIRAINSCKVFVLLWTAHANTSQHILNEIDQAFNRSNTIIPFRIEAVDPSLSLTYYISRAQWLDAFTPPLEEHIHTLAGIILSYLGRAPEIRPEPLPAPSEPAPAVAVTAVSTEEKPEEPRPVEAATEPAPVPPEKEEQAVQRSRPAGGISARIKGFIPVALGVLVLAALVWLFASGAFQGLSAGHPTHNPSSTATTVQPVFTDTPIPATATVTPIPPTATATIRPSATATPLPAWIKDFSGPILNAIANRPADIQDDFSKMQLGWNLHVYNPGVDCSNTTETISNGKLQLSAGPDTECYAQASLFSALSNYVLQVDVDFSRLDPVYKASIMLNSHNLTLRSDGTWGMVSCQSQSCYFSEHGKVALDPAHPVTVQLISFGGRFAFYVNGVPAHYSERSEPISGYELRFDVASEGRTSVSNNIGEFDNLKVWNLDKVDLSSVVK